jgi:short-subunit dehydrogenase
LTPGSRERGELARRYGPWALVAGASEGIGAAFARALAEDGFNLILVARRAVPLDALAEELGGAHRISVTTIPCDLGETGTVPAIVAASADREIGLLVYNAASSSVGPFLATPAPAHAAMIDVNARAPVLLAHALAGSMARRKRGGIVLMSSLTAFQGTPLVATYGATKAFNLVLAEALWSELASHGIDVVACCAGATTTPGYDRVTPRSSEARFGPRPQAPGDVAREALAALGRRPVAITGFANRLASFVMRRVLSRRQAVSVMTRAMKARYDPGE